MATNPFTLAALATTAVEGIAFSAATDDGSNREYERVAATTVEGEVLSIVIPRTPKSLERMRNEVTALAAASEGVRERLPFEVTQLLGRAPVGNTELFIWRRLGGTPMELESLGDDGLAASIGAALAGIHELPTSIVADSGLPHRSSARVREDLLRVFDKAAQTGRVPAGLLERWERAADNPELWQFTPTVVHGDLGAPALRIDLGRVSGIEGWHSLSVGDPARDLAWLLGSAQFDAVDEAFVAYASHRSTDRHLRARGMLHAELDIARWLLFGVDAGDQRTIDDAASMMHALIERVDDAEDDSVKIQPQRLDTMDLSEVQQMLDKNASLGMARGSLGASGSESAAASAADHEATVPVADEEAEAADTEDADELSDLSADDIDIDDRESPESADRS